LRRSPADRYPSALELARDLRHAIEGTEIEPTTRISVRPPAGPIPQLEIPDLALPSRDANVPRRDSRSTALQASPHAPVALNKTELAPANVPSRHPSPVASPPRAMSASAHDLAVRPPAPGPASSRVAATPSAAPASGGSAGRMLTDQGLSGVMFAPSAVTSPQRRVAAPPHLGAPLHEPTQDLSFLVGIAVVGLTSIGATAALMSFAHQPDGFGLVAMVTKPTPMLSLVVQGGLALVCLVFGAKCASGAVKKWRGEIMGGHGGAIFFAIVAGALFFAAIELARAAW
jgi:hypothetical protein